MSREAQVFFAVKEIKELEFSINENFELGPTYDFNYHVELRNDIPQEKITFTITASFMVNKTTEVFMKGKSATIFVIKDFKNYVQYKDGREGVDLPDPIWVALFSIAFTHARALLAKSSSGTKYSHMLMPLINPEQEFKKIFGPHLK